MSSTFFLSFLPFLSSLFPCGWVCFVLFVSLTKEKTFTGAKSRRLPCPGEGPSDECKTEITSEGDVQSAGHAY